MGSLMRESVLPVFGENLRALCALRAPVPQVARDLGLNRMQMRRFLNGESFPKPNQLQRICAYFGVDARILTERLTKAQLDQIRRLGRIDVEPDFNRAIKEAADFIGDLDPFFEPNHELPDGLYEILARSLFQPSVLAQLRVQVTTLRKARVVRGVTPKPFFEAYSGFVGGSTYRQREVRGMLLRQSETYMISFFHEDPRRMVATFLLAPSLRTDLAAFEGFYSLTRTERDGLPRATRCLMRRVTPSCRNLIAMAHRPQFVPFSDAPDEIQAALSRPL
jgi:transcriptional regulator with XRE-family HTH domain